MSITRMLGMIRCACALLVVLGLVFIALVAMTDPPLIPVAVAVEALYALAFWVAWAELP